jgi:hypothetical protein
MGEEDGNSKGEGDASAVSQHPLSSNGEGRLSFGLL